jgi:hypothetical protein
MRRERRGEAAANQSVRKQNQYHEGKDRNQGLVGSSKRAALSDGGRLSDSGASLVIP